MNQPLVFDAGLFAWTLITFGVMVAVLGRFAFRPLRELLARREAAIRDSLDQAARVRAEADVLLERNRQSLAEAREQARALVEEGRRLAADLRRETQETARQEAQQLVAHARAEIQREAERGLGELKATVANLSVRIASEFIRERAAPEDHARMAEQFIERLKKTHAHDAQ